MHPSPKFTGLVVSALLALTLTHPATATNRPAAAHALVPWIVVTDASLAAAFEPLAAAHTAAGLTAEVHTLQEIRPLFPAGRDDAEKIRMFLQDAHARLGTRFVLMGGDEPLLPMRRVFVRGLSGLTPADRPLPTDQYYACLAGDWNADGDSLWGELPFPPAEAGDGVDPTPVLNVGRAPVTTPAEAAAFVQKTLAPSTLSGPVSALLAAGDINHGYPSQVDLALTTEPLVPWFEALPTGARLSRLYLHAADWPGSLPESRASLLASLGGGWDFAVLSGQGGPGIFVAGLEPQDDVTPADLLALSAPPVRNAFVLSAYTHQPGIASIGGALVRAPLGGAVSAIGPTDVEFIAMTGQFMREYFTQGFASSAASIGEVLTAAIVNANAWGGGGEYARLSTLGNVLYGDPALAWPGRRDQATPVEVSLVSAQAFADHVELAWYTPATAAPGATVYRRTEAGEWSAIGSVTPDAGGTMAFRDDAVAAATRYGYRLGMTDAGAGRFVGETWVSVPAAARFALAGALPNPVTRGFAVAFSLPDASPARLDVVDLAGRRVFSRDVGALGAGAHMVDLADGRTPPPGVYMVRLARGERTLTTRACVVR